VTIPDYVAIGILAVCLTLWAGTALLSRAPLGGKARAK
jgi:hypothetical protein